MYKRHIGPQPGIWPTSHTPALTGNGFADNAQPTASHQSGQKHGLVASRTRPNWGPSHNPGVCPDQDSNQ